MTITQSQLFKKFNNPTFEFECVNLHSHVVNMISWVLKILLHKVHIVEVFEHPNAIAIMIQ